jgi:threonine/homoserine/homoserine lactone efflux protein
MSPDPGPSTLTPSQIIERKMDYLAEMIGDVQQNIERRSPSEEAMRTAVRDGIVAAASDPHVWSVAIETLKQNAQNQAGGWLLGRVKSFLSTLAWLFVIGMLVYMMGGWSALMSFLKTGSPPQ